MAWLLARPKIDEEAHGMLEREQSGGTGREYRSAKLTTVTVHSTVYIQA